MVKKESIFSKLMSAFTLAEPAPRAQTDGPKQVTVQYEALGSTGIQNYGGYYQEDYLSTLQGNNRADFIDRMRRSDPKIKMLLSAVKNPIKSAQWSVDKVDDTPQQEQIAELIKHILFNDMDKSWTSFVHEVLTMVDFGHSVFEVVDKVVMGHKKFGNYNSIRSLSFRSPRTIYRFNLDPLTGKLVSISQYAYGDLNRQVDIPADSLMVFTNDKEGDNYEGISWLRPCVGAYKRKDHHLKLEAIGIEKYAIPTPILKVPENKENSPEKTVAESVMKKYTTHEQQWISIPFGWEIDFLKNDFDPSKVRAAIDKDNVEMVHAFLANFLELGQSGSGSYALSFDLSDFFLGSIEHLACFISEEINRSLIPRLVKLNFGPQEEYPKMRCSGITDKAGKEFAEVLKLLVEAKALIPDDDLEKDVRTKYKLPNKSDVGQRSMDPQPAPMAGPAASTPPQVTPPALAPKLSETLLLVEQPNIKKQINREKDALTKVYKTGLGAIAKNVISKVMERYRALPAHNKLSAIKDIHPDGLEDYKNKIRQQLIKIAGNSIDQIKKEIPNTKHVQLQEGDLKLAAPTYTGLPDALAKRIEALAELLTGSQLADLEKNIFFRYIANADSADISDEEIEALINDEAQGYITSAGLEAGASTTAAGLVNDARSAYYLDDEVSKEIESYTFMNEDPVTQICQDLVGTVFTADDPERDNLQPPLHFGCKSWIAVNLVKNADTNDPLTKGGLTAKATKEGLATITLSDHVPTNV